MQITVNERLKIILEDSGLNKSAFASRTGISRPAVDNMFRGVIPQMRTLKAICTTFGVNENWLINGTGEKYVKGNIELNANVPQNDNQLIQSLRDHIKFLEGDLAIWRETAKNLSAHLGKPNALELLAGGRFKKQTSVSGVNAA